MSKSFKQLIISILGFVLLPSVWFIATDLFQIANPLLLPSLKQVLVRLIELFQDGSIINDSAATALRWSLGFSLGVVSGIFFGLLLGISNKLKIFTEFSIEFFRSLPVTAIFPLFLIIFGVGDSSKIAMAFTPTFLLMLINTSYGVSLCDPTRRRMARVFGASRLQVFRYVVLMDALPQIFVGLRLALAQSLIVTVVSEMFIGTDLGLGQRIYDSYLTSSVSTLYALLIVLGIIGYLANKILVLLERRYTFWTGK